MCLSLITAEQVLKFHIRAKARVTKATTASRVLQQAAYDAQARSRKALELEARLGFQLPETTRCLQVQINAGAELNKLEARLEARDALLRRQPGYGLPGEVDEVESVALPEAMRELVNKFQAPDRMLLKAAGDKVFSLLKNVMAADD